MIMQKIFFSIVLVFMVFSGNSQTKKVRDGNFVIKYDNKDEMYALACARILNFVWEKSDKQGFNLPKKVKFNLKKSTKNRNRLVINTYFKKITLEYTSLDPSIIRANFVYGLCHEMGHLCMSEMSPNRNRFTKDNREGWADYFGISMARLLHEIYGLDVWPIPYNYLAQHAESTNRRTPVLEKGEGNNYGFYISAIFWEKFVNEKEMDIVPTFFRQLRSNQVRSSGANQRFRAELVKLGVSNDLLVFFDKNKQHLIR
jgi:hypothetical protein